MDVRRLTFRVPAAREDEVAAELWVLGTDGIQVRLAGGESAGEEVLDAYFDKSVRIAAEDLDRLRARYGAELIQAVDVEPQDWLAAYRALCEPMTIGPFRIDPREPEPCGPRAPSPGLAAGSGDAGGEAADRAGGGDGVYHSLRIPARNAFGTGSHESTRLLLEELGELDLAGRSVLDVGTGSGILAFAALCRGARTVAALDPDVGAVVTARDNTRLNALAPHLFAGRVDALSGRFDVVLVNILPQRWLDEAPAVVRTLRPGGSLYVSGLLESERDQVRATPTLAPLELRSSRTLGDWTALHLLRPE